MLLPRRPIINPDEKQPPLCIGRAVVEVAY